MEVAVEVVVVDVVVEVEVEVVVGVDEVVVEEEQAEHVRLNDPGSLGESRLH